MVEDTSSLGQTVQSTPLTPLKNKHKCNALKSSTTRTAADSYRLRLSRINAVSQQPTHKTYDEFQFLIKLHRTSAETNTHMSVQCNAIQFNSTTT